MAENLAAFLQDVVKRLKIFMESLIVFMIMIRVVRMILNICVRYYFPEGSWADPIIIPWALELK